ncbi:MAG: hypothetical protein K9L56_14575 [Clostridiales bacterium]|nr:hypothetical protein [Clostridiales bacterium]
MSEVIDMYQENRVNEVRNALINVSERVIHDYCELAELLHEVWQGQYHKEYGYKSFSDYVEAELDIKGRKAHFLVQITKTLNYLGIPWDEVREVGWRKMGCISSLMNENNAQYWIEQAQTLNLSQLSNLAKEYRSGNKFENEPIVRMTIQTTEDGSSIIKAAMDHAIKTKNAKNNSEALEKICYDWFQNEV